MEEIDEKNESQIELNNENENIVKISRYAFNSFSIERSIRDLVDWESRGKVDIPNFQRKFVWDYNKCCKFIESILMNLPVPTMFMFRERTSDSEKYILVDGLQRFTCIKQFMDGVYDDGEKKREFKINIKNSVWKDFKYCTLNEDDKSSFNDYSLKIHVFDSGADYDEATKKLYMSEIFERINSGSEKLTDQEIRNAIYVSSATKALNESGKNPKLCKLLSLTNKYSWNRGYAEEFILRVLTYNRIYKNSFTENKDFLYEGVKITSSKKNMLSQYLYLASKNKINIVEDLKSFNNAIDIVEGFSTGAFKGVNKEQMKLYEAVNETIAEALLICVMNGKDIKVSSDCFDKAKIDFWHKTDNDINPFYTSTTSKENVVKRVEEMEKMIDCGDLNE